MLAQSNSDLWNYYLHLLFYIVHIYIASWMYWRVTPTLAWTMVFAIKIFGLLHCVWECCTVLYSVVQCPLYSQLLPRDWPEPELGVQWATSLSRQKCQCKVPNYLLCCVNSVTELQSYPPHRRLSLSHCQLFILVISNITIQWKTCTWWTKKSVILVEMAITPLKSIRKGKSWCVSENSG